MIGSDPKVAHPLEKLISFLASAFIVLVLGTLLVFTFWRAIFPTEPKAGTFESYQNKDITLETPIRIVAEKAGVDTRIENPASDNVATLDQALTLGAVRYPGSGFPGKGNMFLFGHSSHLSFVRNQAYKAFNNIENLNNGDIIQVYSESNEYRYRVTSVRLDKDSEVLVDFSNDKNMLTLSTCDNFGGKQDRFVVEAEFVGVETL